MSESEVPAALTESNAVAVEEWQKSGVHEIALSVECKLDLGDLVTLIGTHKELRRAHLKHKHEAERYALLMNSTNEAIVKRLDELRAHLLSVAEKAAT